MFPHGLYLMKSIFVYRYNFRILQFLFYSSIPYFSSRRNFFFLHLLLFFETSNFTIFRFIDYISPSDIFLRARAIIFSLTTQFFFFRSPVFSFFFRIEGLLDPINELLPSFLSLRSLSISLVPT